MLLIKIGDGKKSDAVQLVQKIEFHSLHLIKGILTFKNVQKSFCVATQCTLHTDADEYILNVCLYKSPTTLRQIRRFYLKQMFIVHFNCFIHQNGVQ